MANFQLANLNKFSCFARASFSSSTNRCSRFSYMSNQYPVNQSGFPSQQNAYQNQSVYGNNNSELVFLHTHICLTGDGNWRLTWHFIVGGYLICTSIPIPPCPSTCSSSLSLSWLIVLFHIELMILFWMSLINKKLFFPLILWKILDKPVTTILSLSFFFIKTRVTPTQPPAISRYSGSINALTSKLKGTPGAFER